ncbi:MAG TPA: hypothetical protein VEY10_08515 [Flavisolibacter sp.]|nr:hypothetical protein [Flavisolibacter sp.]
MDNWAIKQMFSKMDLLHILDLYFEVRTGNPCFSDEFLPVKILSELHRIEATIRQLTGQYILENFQIEESETGCESK